MNGTIQILNRLLDISKKAEFKAKFSGDHHDTLGYIFEMRKFNRINKCNDPSVEFSRVFNTIDPHFQNRFMRSVPSVQTLTIALLEKWIIDRFPPPQTKYQFIVCLKLIRMRFNESPLFVYERYTSKLHQVNEAIKLLNNRAGVAKIEPISDETKVDILTNIFIRQNDRAKPSKMEPNDGAINKLVVKYIAQKDPTSIADWTQLFVEMKTELIPSVLSTLPEYEYKVYPPSPHDDDIYLKQNDITKSPDTDVVRDDQYPLQESRGTYTDHNDDGDGINPSDDTNPTRVFRKRRSFFDDNYGPSYKRRRANDNDRFSMYCARCKRTDHVVSDCIETTDVDGVPLGACRKCGSNTHWHQQCRVKTEKADQMTDDKPLFKPQTTWFKQPSKSINALESVVNTSFGAIANDIMQDGNLTYEEKQDRWALLSEYASGLTEYNTRLNQ
eukprot:783479_1